MRNWRSKKKQFVPTLGKKLKFPDVTRMSPEKLSTVTLSKQARRK